MGDEYYNVVCPMILREFFSDMCAKDVYELLKNKDSFQQYEMKTMYDLLPRFPQEDAVKLKPQLDELAKASPIDFKRYYPGAYSWDGPLTMGCIENDNFFMVVKHDNIQTSRNGMENAPWHNLQEKFQGFVSIYTTKLEFLPTKLSAFSEPIQKECLLALKLFSEQ